MSRNILVTGATGKQGGGVVSQLANHPDFTILAVTRNPSSPNAQKILSKASNIKLIQGDQNDVPALFSSAAKEGQIWGVFSIQIAQGQPGASGGTKEGEIKQGCDMFDASIKHGVKHFVYTSIERGGDDKSWDVQTNVTHFQTKYAIERHLREKAEGSNMAWTILRPTAFMDNLAPTFGHRVFMAAMYNTLPKDKKLPWIACADIGAFARIAFEDTKKWDRVAIALAGEELTIQELCDKVERKCKGVNFQPTFWIFGALMKKVAKEMGDMIDWFASDGYVVDVDKLRRIHPGLMDFETWLGQEDSPFAKYV